MGKTRAKKVAELEEIRERFKTMHVAVLTLYSGLSVNEESKLRKLLRETKAEYFVVKKTLLKIALKENGYDLTTLDAVTKPFGITFGFGDESETAKLIAKFQKSHESVEFVGGYLGGQALTAQEVQALAKLPARPELLGQLVRTVQAPVAEFVSVLRGNLIGFLTVLSSIRDPKTS